MLYNILEPVLDCIDVFCVDGVYVGHWARVILEHKHDVERAEVELRGIKLLFFFSVNTRTRNFREMWKGFDFAVHLKKDT